MQCSICAKAGITNSVALRVVGTGNRQVGFCKTHEPEAFIANAKLAKIEESKVALKDTTRGPTNTFARKVPDHAHYKPSYNKTGTGVSKFI